MAQSDVELLGRVPIFTVLDSPQLHVLAFSGTRITLEPGEVLYEANSRVGAGYLVLEGSAEAVGPENAEPVPVGPGAFLAQLSMIADLPAAATVRARSPMRVLKIEHGVFARVCSEFPDAGGNVLAVLAQRLDTCIAELRHVQRGFEGARRFGP